MDVMTKSIAVAYDTKVLDASEGVVQALVSVTANRDTGGDVILPGAHKWGLEHVTPKGVVAHDWSRTAAKAIEAYEVMPGDKSLPGELLTAGFGALRVKAQFNLKTTCGRDAFADVEFYEEEQEWSIGYAGFGAYIAGPGFGDEKTWERTRAMLPPVTVKAIEEAHGATRFLPQVKSYEFSTVLFGMNSDTVTESVKGGEGGALAELVAAEVQRALEKIKVIDTPKHTDPAPLEVKLWIEDDAFEGSAEAFIDAVQDAAQAWLAANVDRAPQGEPGCYPWARVVASYADSCIVTIDGLAPDPVTHEDEITLRFPLSYDGENVTLGTPTEVELEVVVVDAAADAAEDAAEGQSGAPVGATPADVLVTAAASFDVHVLELEHSIAHVAGAVADDVKAGAVQARRNRERLTTAATAIQAMLDELPSESADDDSKSATDAQSAVSGDPGAALVAALREELESELSDVELEPTTV